MRTKQKMPGKNRADWNRCPTALTAALERAVATGNRELERDVLQHLAGVGIVVVDRVALAKAVASSDAKEVSA